MFSNVKNNRNLFIAIRLSFLSLGQLINLTLFDFGIWTRQASDQSGTFCNSYGVVREGPSLQQTICGGDKRMRNVYISKSNAIEIVMTHQIQRFFLEFNGKVAFTIAHASIVLHKNIKFQICYIPSCKVFVDKYIITVKSIKL